MGEYIDKSKLIDRLDELCNTICQYSKKQRAVMCGSCELGISFEVIDGFPCDKGYHDGVKRGIEISTPKWIPVTERLPDFEGMCLCMRKSYSNEKIRYQEIMYFDFDEQAFCSNVDGIFVADGNVTHWMPLPEPPKDGET